MIRLITAFFLCALTLSSAQAEIFSTQSLRDTDTIVVKPDGPAIINLDQDIGSVIVANPTHARVVVDNQRTIILMPETPGSTELVVMGTNGAPLLEKKVIVSSVTKGSYLTIKRACINSSAEGCTPVSVYYCPDRCHIVDMPGLTQASANGAGSGGTAGEELSGAAGPGSATAGPPPVTSGGAASEGS